MNVRDLSKIDRELLTEFLKDLSTFIQSWPAARRERLDRERRVAELQEGWRRELRRKESGRE